MFATTICRPKITTDLFKYITNRLRMFMQIYILTGDADMYIYIYIFSLFLYSIEGVGEKREPRNHGTFCRTENSIFYMRVR